MPTERITYRHLILTANGLPDDAWRQQNLVDFLVSKAVVNHYMGEEWLERYVSPFEERPSYFRIGILDGQTMSLTDSFKLVDLAELLFNLQHVPGFDHCVQRMRDGGDLEGSFAELETARLIYINDWPFRFVEPIGGRHTDYDFEITFRDGFTVCADAKCKIERTPLSENTIVNTLRKARSQLPDDRPGLPIVKFPASWIAHADLRNMFNQASAEVFRSSGRLVGVSYCSVSIAYENSAVAQTHYFHDVPNHNNRFDAGRDWRLFREWWPKDGAINSMPEKWTRLSNFPLGLPEGPPPSSVVPSV